MSSDDRADQPGRFSIRRLRRRYVGLTFAGLTLLGLVITCAHGFVLAGDLQDGRRQLLDAAQLAEAGGFALTSAQAAAIRADLDSGDAALDRAESALHDDPFIGWLRILPVLGQQITAADEMVAASRKLTSRHAEISTLLDEVITARDTGTGPARIALMARLLGSRQAEFKDLLTAFDEADRLVAGIPADGLLGPVASGRSLLLTRLEQARPLVAGAREAVTLIPALVGVGGEKRYLVLALDNAEIRPIGGLIGAFATPKFTDGLLSDTKFRDVQSIDKPGQKTFVAPPGPLADHLLGNTTWQVADAGWSPDFAQSAADTRRMYKVETSDDNFQGTIAFTPEFVDALLTVVGPVAIPSAGITVHAGETYLVSLEQVEVLNRGEGRKQFLADLASTVLDRLFALPASKYPAVLAALDTAGRRRDLQILLDDSAPQASLARLGWYVPFTFPAAGDRLAIMEANVAPVSKLDVLLKLDHELDVVLQPDGSANESLVTTFTNGFGPKLPPALERVRSTFFDGILGSYQRRYLAPQAEVLSVSSDDPTEPITDPDAVGLEDGSMVVGNYQFVRPGVVHLTTTYTAPGVVELAAGNPLTGTYRLVFRKQPGRSTDTLRVRVTVPPGSTPTTWSDGGILDGLTVTFSVTTEYDHTFEVSYVTR